MNKLVLVLATAATFGLGTAAFAASPSTASTQERVQPAQSQATGAHKMKASHRAGAKKVMVRHHRSVHLKASIGRRGGKPRRNIPGLLRQLVRIETGQLRLSAPSLYRMRFPAALCESQRLAAWAKVRFRPC